MTNKTFKFYPGDVVYAVHPLNDHLVINTFMVSKISFTKDKVEVSCRSLVSTSGDCTYSENSLLTSEELYQKLEPARKQEAHAS